MSEWNKPSSPDQPVKTTGGKPKFVKGILAGLVVVIGAAVAFIVLTSGKEAPTAKKSEKKPAAIKDAIPAPAPKTSTNEAARAEKPWPPPNAYQDEHGIWRHPGGARVFDPRDRERAIKSPTVSNVPKFAHPVEREIATLLTVKPGMLLVGTPRYDALQRDLANALVDKIEITEEDSERDRKIKEDVIAAKKELVERLKKGEDIIEILKETRKELQRLSQYKREVQSLITEQVRNAASTDSDIEDAFAAANKLLEAKGIAPMSASPILKRRHRALLTAAKKSANSEK